MAWTLTPPEKSVKAPCVCVRFKWIQEVQVTVRDRICLRLGCTQKAIQLKWISALAKRQMLRVSVRREKCVMNRKCNAREWRKKKAWQFSWYWITSDCSNLKKGLVTVSAPTPWVIRLPELLRFSVSCKWISLFSILIDVLKPTLLCDEQQCMPFWQTIYQMSSCKPCSLTWNYTNRTTDCPTSIFGSYR